MAVLFYCALAPFFAGFAVYRAKNKTLREFLKGIKMRSQLMIESIVLGTLLLSVPIVADGYYPFSGRVIEWVICVYCMYKMRKAYYPIPQKT